MTNREFLEAVVKGTMNDEIKAFAVNEIEKLNSKNEARRNSANSKKEEENAPLRAKMVEILRSSEEPLMASQVATLCEVSTSKASALLGQLVERGTATKSEIKVPKVGKRFAYSLVR